MKFDFLCPGLPVPGPDSCPVSGLSVSRSGLSQGPEPGLSEGPGHGLSEGPVLGLSINGRSGRLHSGRSSVPDVSEGCTSGLLHGCSSTWMNLRSFDVYVRKPQLRMIQGFCSDFISGDLDPGRSYYLVNFRRVSAWNLGSWAPFPAQHFCTHLRMCVSRRLRVQLRVCPAFSHDHNHKGHVPYSKDCGFCQMAGLKRRQHRRRGTPVEGTLALDLVRASSCNPPPGHGSES